MKPRSIVAAGTVAAAWLAVHTLVNVRFLRRPAATGPDIAERVSICVPARNEARHIGRTVADLLAQEGLPDLEVLVLDDGSTDTTADILHGFNDPRLTVITSPDEPPPPGWLGKSWACARLAEQATGTVLVFADADVAFGPHAVRAAIAELRSGGFAMVSPFPREVADDWLGRLVQPLLTWSWVATVPLRLAEWLPWTSFSAANGQFLVFDADAYRAIGGHGAVGGQILEDICLMRTMKAAKLRATPVDASGLVECRMYETPQELVDGYAKSLWSAFGGPVPSLAANGLLLITYLVPPVAALVGRRRDTRLIGALGYFAGVASRATVAGRVGGRVWPDSMAQPASIVAFAALNGISWYRHRRGLATWKDRPLMTHPTATVVETPHSRIPL